MIVRWDSIKESIASLTMSINCTAVAVAESDMPFTVNRAPEQRESNPDYFHSRPKPLACATAIDESR